MLDIYKKLDQDLVMKFVEHLPLKSVLKASMKPGDAAVVRSRRTYNVSTLKSFAVHGCKCVECGRIGTRIKVWIDNGGGTHIDLFTEDGMLMTRDHIIPKSKKGANSIWNYQTMCRKCNTAKGNADREKDLMVSQFRNLWRDIHLEVHRRVMKYNKNKFVRIVGNHLRATHLHLISYFIAKIVHKFA